MELPFISTAQPAETSATNCGTGAADGSGAKVIAVQPQGAAAADARGPRSPPPAPAGGATGARRWLGQAQNLLVVAEVAAEPAPAARRLHLTAPLVVPALGRSRGGHALRWRGTGDRGHVERGTQLAPPSVTALTG